MNFLLGIFLSIFFFVFLNKNMKGVILLNFLLIPLIIIIILMLGMKMDIEGAIFENANNNYFWIFNSIIYESYNSITLVSILIPIKKYINNKRDIFIISFFCIIIIRNFSRNYLCGSI